MKKELSRVIPILPPQYMAEIQKAGGWFEFRDQAIMELSKNHVEIKQAQVRTIARLRQKKRLLLSA